MFSAIRRTFGAISVREGPTDIVVDGIPADIIARDISRLWTTSRINQWMFTKIAKNSFAFPKFFAVEVHYMLQQLEASKQAKSSRRTIKHLIHELEAETWLKRLAEEPVHRLDMSQLHNLNFDLFSHQHDFLKYYDVEPNRYELYGALAAAAPGTGKTIMSLAVAECLHADLITIISPKVALDRVWIDTIQKLFKKVPTIWNAVDGKPYHGERIILGHYEALAKVQQVALSAKHSKPVLIVDESHNFNEGKSNRTQALVALRESLKCMDTLLLSGTPLKAMGYEVASLLKMLDPLFTEAVEARFMKIFGRETGRALDILRHRVGKLSYRIEAEAVITNETHSENLNIALKNGQAYTLEAVRTQMQSYVVERTHHYQKYFKSYKAAYEEGIKAFEAVMAPEQKADLRRYQAAVKDISKGYDPVRHKVEAEFANHFENKVILPSIPDKRIRDGFKEAKSVIKYVSLKIMGEALAHVVGRARINVHLDMVRSMDWKAIAAKSRKKVIVFTSYVEVVKEIEKALGAAGFKYAVVTGETSSNVAGIVGNFGKNDDEKFLIATYQSLSTAVPLTMADVTVFINSTWRDYEMQQAKARTDRIGQDGAVTFIHTFLDTGKEANISTRAKDILEWSKAQVEAMMGPGNDPKGIDKELTKDINIEALEAFSEEGTGFSAAFEAFLAEHDIDEAFGENSRPEIMDVPATEALISRHERNDGFKRRILIRALGLFAYIPELTFDDSDVDMATVAKLQKHPDLLRAIDSWIDMPDQELIPKLREARRVFASFQKPAQYTKLYRGFNPKSVEQETMGLQRQGFFGPTSAKVKVGDTFTHTTQRALSFTHHEGTASAFGGMVVAIDPRQYVNDLLEITPEICYALCHLDVRGENRAPYYTTYGELVLLPSAKPVQFHVVSINNKK